jgi:hypothetical protein
MSVPLTYQSWNIALQASLLLSSEVVRVENVSDCRTDHQVLCGCLLKVLPTHRDASLRFVVLRQNYFEEHNLFGISNIA